MSPWVVDGKSECAAQDHLLQYHPTQKRSEREHDDLLPTCTAWVNVA